MPVVAALHGAVTGGGLVIATAAHLRLASADVKIGVIARTGQLSLYRQSAASGGVIWGSTCRI